MLRSFYIILLSLCIGILFVSCDTMLFSTVEFIVDGEVYYTLDTSSETLSLPDNPTKEGFIFEGWYLDKDDFEQSFNIDSILNTVGNNIKVYAKWSEDPNEIDAFTIIFHTNGGSDVDSIEFDSASDIAIPDAPYREGYTFGGWYTDNQDFEEVFAFEILLEQDWELYAKWIPNTYTVTFDASGGVFTTTTLEIEYSSNYNLAIPEKTGYIFDGWYDSSNINCSLTGKWKVADDITLHAKWIATEYDIVLDVNGGNTLSSDTVTVSYESEYALPQPSREGYDFIDWYTDADISFNSNGTYRILENISLHAIWQAKIYELDVICNNNDAGNVTDGGEIIYSNETTVTASTNCGYVFCGWYENDIKLAQSESYTFSMPAKNLTLTAKWSAATISLTLNSNGGEALANNTSEVIYRENFIIEQIPTRQYYIFDGWRTGNGNGEQLTDNTGKSLAKLSIAENSEIFASWKADYEDNFIVSADDLDKMSLEKDYILLVDIDYADEEWTPKGNMRDKYKGVFDGGGHVISNFIVSDTTSGNIGLFGSNEGTIKNITLSDFEYDIDCNKVLYAGGLVGYNMGQLLNCRATGDISLAGKYAYSGGLVGLNFEGSLTACSADVNIAASTTNNYAIYIGGLAGQNYNGNIANCAAFGDVYGLSLSRVYSGGLIGDNYGAVYNSFSSGTVDAISTENNAIAGGLIGCNTSLILNSFALGDTTATSECSAFCGALTGYDDVSMVMNCYYNNNQSIVGDTICSVGTACPLQNFQSEMWITNNLWANYDKEFWYFEEAAYPILNSNSDNIYNTIIDIETKEQLQNIQGSARNYSVVNDIDLDDNNWQPLIFGGALCGNGNTIHNFSITSNTYCGLFGYNTGKISDLKVSDFSISVNSSNSLAAGGIVGVNNFGEIVNCYSSGSINAASLYDISIGGLTGINIKGAIINSYAEVDILLDGSIIKGRGSCGGLAGNNFNGIIQGCYATNDITINATTLDTYDFTAGGLLGYDYYGTIGECYAVGDITITDNASNTIAGGLIGQKNNGKLSLSFAVGDISGTDSVLAGGLLGYSQNAKICDCYNSCCQCLICNTISEYCAQTSQTNLQCEAFLTQIGYGKYISQNDLTEHSDNIWVFANNNYPELYWQ